MFSRFCFILLAVLLPTGIFLMATGCSSGLDPTKLDDPTETTTTAIEFGNFAQGSEELTITVDGNQIITGLAPGEFSGDKELYNSPTTVTISIESSSSAYQPLVIDKQIQVEEFNFVVVFKDTLADQGFNIRLMPDELSVRDDYTIVRFINLIPGTPTWEALIDNHLTITQLYYNNLSVPMVFESTSTETHDVYLLEDNNIGGQDILLYVDAQVFSDNAYYTGYIWGEYSSSGINLTIAANR